MSVMPPRDRVPSTPLDDVSKAIIEQLQQDGRRPYAAIGKAVGLSEAAVRQRVQRLHESGVMQIVAVTDPMQVGFARAAMIGIRVDGDAEVVAPFTPGSGVRDRGVCSPKQHWKASARKEESYFNGEVIERPHRIDRIPIPDLAG